jgi:prepilin-type processing-associated H-X9-DG protein
MVMLADGAQLLRPPSIVQANGNLPDNSGLWGTHQPGSGAGGTTAWPAAVIADNRRLITGTLTNVVYVDGHVKSVNPKTLTSSTIVLENGGWRGTAAGGATVAGNPGWTRD